MADSTAKSSALNGKEPSLQSKDENAIDQSKKETETKQENKADNKAEDSQEAQEKSENKEKLKEKDSNEESSSEIEQQKTASVELLIEDHYKRIGFYYSIEDFEQTNLENLIREYETDLELQIEEKKKNHESVIRNYQNLVQNNQQKVNALNLDSSENSNLRIELKQLIKEAESQKLKADEKLISPREALVGFYKEYHEEKNMLIENMVDKRLENLYKERDKLIEESSKFRNKINEEFNETNRGHKPALNEFIEELKEYGKQTFCLLTKAQEKIENLNESIINRNTLRILASFGFSAVLAAGWFFSVFAEKTELGNSDSYFFWLGNVFNLGASISLKTKSSGFSPIQVYFLTLLFWTALLAIVTLIFKLANKWMNDNLSQNLNLPNQNEEDKNLSPSENENGIDQLIQDLMNSNKQSQLIKWLHLAPVIYLVGIALFTLSFFEAIRTEDVTNLSNALSGELIGMAVSLGISGLVFLYVNYIVDNRFKKENQRTQNFRNVELLISMFLIPIGILYLILENYFGSDTHGASLFMFFVLSILAGFCLGYNIKYTSLVSTKSDLEHQWAEVQRYIADIQANDTRYQLGFGRHNNTELQNKVDMLNEDILRLIRQKNEEAYLLRQGRIQHSADELFKDEKKKEQEKIEEEKKREQASKNMIKSVTSFFQSLLKNSEPAAKSEDVKEEKIANGTEKELSNQTTTEITKAIDKREYSSISKEYLSHLDKAIEAAENELKSLEENAKAANEELRHYQKEQRDFNLNINKKIEALERETLKVESLMQDSNKQFMNELNTLKIRFEQIKTDLKDGYELGKWYLNNKIAPQTT